MGIAHPSTYCVGTVAIIADLFLGGAAHLIEHVERSPRPKCLVPQRWLLSENASWTGS